MSEPPNAFPSISCGAAAINGLIVEKSQTARSPAQGWCRSKATIGRSRKLTGLAMAQPNTLMPAKGAKKNITRRKSIP
jgi:hypothetical protein